MTHYKLLYFVTKGKETASLCTTQAQYVTDEKVPQGSEKNN